jgi:cytochrome c oxidase subunit 2
MPKGATAQSQSTLQLWQWSWVAALIVGAIVWFLIIYAVVRFYRRADDEVPIQTRYNFPMEILYTVAPVIIVLVFFKFVVSHQEEITKESSHPDHTIVVIGQQWSWTFNYYKDKDLDGQTTVYEPGTPAQLPTLYLPVNESVRFELRSPDVIHSFWVPAFNYKLDVVPGKVNTFEVTPDRMGTFIGRCSELCGTYHSRMLFNVKIVSKAQYIAELHKLQQAGNTGLVLGGSNDRVEAGLDTNTAKGNL